MEKETHHILATDPIRSLEHSLLCSLPRSAHPAPAGVHHYDLAYQVNDGDWAAWYLATIQTQAAFSAALGHRYAFHLRATDNAGNTSRWVEASTRG